MTIYVDWEGFPWLYRKDDCDTLSLPDWFEGLLDYWCENDDLKYASVLAAVIEATVEPSPVRDRLAKYIRHYEEL